MEENDDNSYDTDLDDDEADQLEKYTPARLSFVEKLAAHRSNRSHETFGQLNVPLEFLSNTSKDTDDEVLVPIRCKIPTKNARVHTYEYCCTTLDIPADWQIRGFLPYNTITLVDRPFSFNDFRALATSIEANLESLTLHAVNLIPSSLYVLCQGLNKCVHLTFLDLSDNKIGKKGFDALMSIFDQLSSLQYLSLANCDIQDSYGLKIGDLCRHKRLLELNLTGNKLEENACIFIGNALTENWSLLYLNLSWNLIRSYASIALFRGIEVNKCLTELDISWSGLSYDGSVALRRVLAVNKVLQRLNISNCHIEWTSAKLISEGLAKNSTLQNLNLAFNPITTHGAQYIIQALDVETSAVSMLDLSGITVFSSTVRLAEKIAKRKEFILKYDCEIPTHDMIGRQGKAAKGDSMRTLVQHIDNRNWRTLEYFRMLNKNNQEELKPEAITLDIVKSDAKLDNEDIQNIHQRLGNISMQPLTYKNLNSIINKQRIRDRSLKARHEKQAQNMKKRNQKILETVSQHFPGIEILSEKQKRQEAIEKLSKPRAISARSKV
ncbi:unnamed protein product [Adineta steineri]|uniref:Uncharacterized protein n=1 Tax=Adineta steineri TaxID=433720 RepID=A0A818G6Y9_9BILA|nr:unnamed protein product [Adineta steineri]